MYCIGLFMCLNVSIDLSILKFTVYLLHFTNTTTSEPIILNSVQTYYKTQLQKPLQTQLSFGNY